MKARRAIATVAVAIIASSTMLIPGVSQAASCAPASHPGGDWPSYGHDLSNTRSQPNETTIGLTNVGSVAAEWTFSLASTIQTGETAAGNVQSTPAVAQGCLYVTTSTGWVFAFNADSGQLVWRKRPVAYTISGVCCGGTLFSPAVSDGVLTLNVSSNPATAPDGSGPYVLALDAATGDTLWRSAPVATEAGSYTNSSSVRYDGLAWIGISNPEMTPLNNIGGFAVVDANDQGQILARTRSVPDSDFNAGMGGGAIWTTAAIDSHGYGYAGTGQPTPWNGQESEFTNAILKFDMARARDVNGEPILGTDGVTNPNFGKVVDHMKGTVDNGTDVDFAASPTLFTTAAGVEMVAEYQKSGVLWGARTDTMSVQWSAMLAARPGGASGNYTSTATDGTNIFGLGVPGLLYSRAGMNGGQNWLSAIPESSGYSPVAYANGVVYFGTQNGVLGAFDATTGTPLLARPLVLDTGTPCPATSAPGGVVIARNRLYTFCGPNLVSYGLPA